MSNFLKSLVTKTMITGLVVLFFGTILVLGMIFNFVAISLI